MGYDIMRFIGEVDEEFHCTICAMVYDNPVQTLCDHSFCDECIREWIRVHAICPVDRRPLTTTDLKPTSRPFRNLLAKLQIKCDFEPQGCTSAIMLENLEDHITACEYNPTAEIVCDKGCNLRMRRHEYQTNSCLRHFADHVTSQAEVIKKLNEELIKEKENSQRALNREKENFQRAFDEQKKDFQNSLDQIRRLNGGVEKAYTPQPIGRPNYPLQQTGMPNYTTQQIGMPNYFMDFSKRLPKWQQVVNMKISACSNMLEPIDSCGAFAQLCHPLDRANYVFKVKILKANYSGDYYGYIGIGLSDSQVAVAFSIGYYNDGKIKVSTGPHRDVPSFAVGDVIECGINFNVNCNDTTVVEVYFNKNGEIITKEIVQMPDGGFYPSVWMYNPEKRVQYIGI